MLIMDIRIHLVLILILIIDLLVAFRKRNRKPLEYIFSKYNMFVIKPGKHSFDMSRVFYNLPGNEDIPVCFEICDDGYLDRVRNSELVLLGGSVAFGTGSTGNEYNISGYLKNTYGWDVVNLAIPGFNIEQEVITIVKHLEAINPNRIAIFDGCNNLALAMPFDYHNYYIGSDPLSFYSELGYRTAVNQHLSSLKDIKYHLKISAKEIFREDLIITPLYRFLSQVRLNRYGINKGGQPKELEALIKIGVKNYLYWLGILVDVCKSRNIELYVFLQPYYMYGRPKGAANNSNFYQINEEFDKYMISGLGQLHSELNNMEYIYYCPLFKNIANESVDLFTDAVHLNNNGYQLIAGIINEELRREK